MLTIHVDNPYHEVTYKTQDITLYQWKTFITNHDNKEIISFYDERSKAYVTINPKNFASVQVVEEENLK